MVTQPLSPRRRRVYTAIGVFFVVLGIAGTLLPIVPGTAFLIVAVVFFARSSEAFHYWLLYNRFFGKYLRGYIEKKAIPLKTTIGFVTFMWVSVTLSSIFIAGGTVGRVVVIGTGALLTAVYFYAGHALKHKDIAIPEPRGKDAQGTGP